MVGRSSYWQGDCGKGRLMAGKLWEGESGGGKGRHLIVEPMFSSLTIHSSDLSFFGGKCPCISASLSFFFSLWCLATLCQSHGRSRTAEGEASLCLAGICGGCELCDLRSGKPNLITRSAGARDHRTETQVTRLVKTRLRTVEM